MSFPKPLVCLRKPLLYFFGSLLIAIPAMADTETYNGHVATARQVLLRLSNPSPALLQQLRLLGDADDVRLLS